MIDLARMNVLLCRAPMIALAHAASDSPTTIHDYVLIPDGHVRSKSGDFRLDAAGAEAIIAAFKAQAIDLVVDREHHTLGGEYSAPDGTALAAGWIKHLRYEKGRGLLGTIHWLAKAAEWIRTGEYKYLSPVVIVDRLTGRALGLHSVALTNVPAIAGFPELLAAAPPQHRRYLIMADKPQDPGQSAETLITNLRTLLGLPETTAPEQVLAAAIEALTSMQAARTTAAKALGLPETAEPKEIILAISKVREAVVPQTELKALKDQVEAQAAVIKTHCARANTAEAANLIERYGKEGKLTTAQAEYELKVLTAKVEEFDARKAEFEERMKVAPKMEMDKTTLPAGGGGPPSDRATIIAKARARFDGEPDLKALTDRGAFVNDALRRAGAVPLAAEERKALDLVAA